MPHYSLDVTAAPRKFQDNNFIIDSYSDYSESHENDDLDDDEPKVFDLADRPIIDGVIEGRFNCDQYGCRQLGGKIGDDDGDL